MRTLPLHIIHPAGAPDLVRLARGVARLRAAGLEVHAPAPPVSRTYLAADDPTRLASVRSALACPAPRALLAARGGYGCMRLLPELAADLEEAARQGRHVLLGYSDITALHAVWNAAGGVSVHAPLAQSFGDDEPRDREIADLRTLLAQGTVAPLHLRCLGARAPERGRLVGGNLSLVAALCGTPWQVDAQGGFLFLEEVGEPLYRVDRLLAQLRLAGVFARAGAIVLGQFTKCGEGDEAAVREAIVRLCAECGLPLLEGAEAGHGRPNRPLLLGATWVCEEVGEGHVVLRAEAPLPQVPRGAEGSGELHAEREGGAVDGRGEAAEGSGGRALRLQPLPTQGAPVLALLEEALRVGIGSGAQLEVWRRGEPVIRIAAGWTARSADAVRAPVTSETCFDLASLTKALATAPLAALARQQGRVALDDAIPAEFSASGATLRGLLTHSSGLPAWEPVFEAVRASRAGEGRGGVAPAEAGRGARQAVGGRGGSELAGSELAGSELAGSELAGEGMRAEAQARFASFGAGDAQRGRSRYSDVGFIALGRWVEALLEDSLSALFARHLAGPLGLTRLGFGVSAEAVRAGGCAATEWCPWRGRTLQGIVHDENAQVLGGAAGHAGLFGCAAEVATLVASFAGHRPSVLEDLTCADMWDPAHRVGSFGLGWDSPSGARSSAGTLLDPRATVGHLGFTGTSVWYDRDRELLVVLLTNRVHPSRDDDRIRGLRPALHDAIVRQIG